MRVDKLEKAMLEAERFLRIATEAHCRLRTYWSAPFSGSKETAAATRASLDLTRILAELRKP